MKDLETLVGRRFNNLSEISELLDKEYQGKNSTVDFVDYEDMDEPEDWDEYDLMINCSLNPNTDADNYGDFEIFYLFTRKKQILVTEINPYGI